MPDEQTANDQVAASPEQNAIAVAAAPEVEKPRDAAEQNAIAADYITRLVGIPESPARHEVGQLIDSEVDEVIAAAVADRHSAKDIIKAVLARAYDRRRESAAAEATAEMETLRRSSLAQQAIEKHTDIKGEKATKVVALLTADELTQLAVLADDPTADEKVAAILNAAEARINTAFAK
jgi:hypothetical protein